MDFFTLGLSLAKSIYNLREGCQQMKIDEKELKELGEHITYINKIFYHKKGGASSSSSNQVLDPHEEKFKGQLKEVKKTIDGWLSKEQGFFSMFTSKRTEELEALNKKIRRAIDAYQLASTKQRDQKLDDLWKAQFNRRGTTHNSKQPPTAKDTKETPTRDSRPSNKGEPRQRSASVEPRKVPRENRDAGPKDSNDQGPIHPRGPRYHEPKPKTLGSSKVHPNNQKIGPKDTKQQGSHDSTHHQQKRETHTWVYLWAPLDSEKQVKDVEDKLKNSRDVKVEKVSCDQPIKKVMVKVKAVEVKDDSKIIQTLLRETRDALPSYKALPTLWDNRPK